MWNWCGTKVGQQKDMNQNVPRCSFFTSVMWCHQPTPWHCNQQLIWLPHHQTSLVPCSSFVMDLLLRRIFECCLFLRWDAIIHSIAQDVAKKTSPLMGVSFRRLSHRNGGQKSCFFSGLTNDWNLGRCTNNTRRNGKQQEEEEEEEEEEGEEEEEEEEEDRRNRRQKKQKTEEEEDRRNRNRRKRTRLLFLWNFFCDFQTRTSDLFWTPKVLQASQGSAPVSGLQRGDFFFQRNFPDEERRHTWSDTFFSWMEYIVGISQAEVFFFVVCFLFVSYTAYTAWNVGVMQKMLEFLKMFVSFGKQY